MCSSASARLTLATPLLILVLAGCGGGTGNAGSGTPPPQIQVTVNGSSSVRLGATTQFTATVTNTNNTAVSWQVNGIVGGNSTVGTINGSGLYTPPSSLPSPATVSITAVSQASSSASGSLTESIFNPLPIITTATIGQSGSSYLLDVEGSGFVVGSQIQIGAAGVATNYISATDIQATITATVGTTIVVDVVNPDPGTATSASMNVQVVATTASAAARLLDQATFGPTSSDIQQVQQIGLDGYLTEQFNTPPTKLPDISNPPPTACATTVTPCEESEWWQTTLAAPDQLRQRVAFALSEMFVISSDTVNGRAITPYANMLASDAFSNFSTIMHDVSLSPGMGAYLNMLDSNVAPPGQIANENYPRELMQLFTIGLDVLNPDGTPQLDGNGNPIQPYSEAQVEAFARAYTGWTYALPGGGSPTSYPNRTANYDDPMAAVESHHDKTAKILLNGTTLPAGQSAEQDLQGALTNIFNHPNVGPFVCKQLIQHLVTSTPSPAYVERVANIFADDGTGVRGNMQAVIRAILMDSEARAGDTDPTYDGGHLREPILWIAEAMRALGYVNIAPNGLYNSLSNYSASLGETPYRSSSVFNFFPPSYVIPSTSLNAPEFGLENTASATLRLTLADNIVSNKIAGFKIDLSATSTLGQLAASDPATLVDTLGLLFMHGQMPAQMRAIILGQITGLTDPAQRVRLATYLVITSSQYKVMH